MESLGAVGARWGSGLVQNDRTDIGKAVLTPGTIGFKLKPNPRERSDHLLISLLARVGVIFTSAAKVLIWICNGCYSVSFGLFGWRFDTECL